MPPPPELTRRYRRQIGIYRDRTAAMLIAAWDRLDTHDQADVATYLQATAAPLAGAKRAAVSLSAAFFATALRIPTVAVDPSKIDPRVNLRAPFLATWHAFAQGRPSDEAIDAGRSMAQALGFDFVQSSARLTGDQVAEASGQTVRWARIPGPNACDWCLSVARDDYLTAESADFGHDRDDCDVVPA